MKLSVSIVKKRFVQRISLISFAAILLVPVAYQVTSVFNQNAQALVGDITTSVGGGTTNYSETNAQNWNHSAVSNSGTRLAATIANGYIYTSIDSGATWTEHLAIGAHQWTAVNMSSNGNTIVAASEGSMYVSLDGGQTWNARGEALEWADVAVSSDGVRMAAVSSGANNTTSAVFTSSDSGTTWVEQAGISEHPWANVAMSTDGSTVLISDGSGSSLYISRDYGVTWSNRLMDDIYALPQEERYLNSISISDEGTLTAFNQTYAFVSKDYGETWESSAPVVDADNSILSTQILPDGSKLYALATSTTSGHTRDLYASTDKGETWATITNPDDTIQSLSSVSFSDDGTHLAGLGNSPYTYTSNNEGQAWSSHTVGVHYEVSNVQEWKKIASSRDGTRLASFPNDTQQGGISYIFTSSDSGDHWTEQHGSPKIQWGSILSSADGSRLVASGSVGADSKLYESTNYGITWSEIYSDNEFFFWNISGSDNGMKLVAVKYDGNVTFKLSLSLDGGHSWNDIVNAPSDVLTTAIISGDGTKIVASGSGVLFTSSDDGNSWENQVNSPALPWTTIAVSYDGNTIVGSGIDYGLVRSVIEISKDGGATWERTLVSSGAWYFPSVAVSADGKKIVVAESNTGLHMSYDTGSTWTGYSIDDPGEVGLNHWSSVSINNSGSQVVATVDGGNIHILRQELPSISIDNVPLVENQTISPQPTFKGTAPANGKVSITLHSDPITCTTVADSNGNWSCTLPSAAPAGNHTLIASVARSDDSQAFSLGPVPVTVSQTTVPGNDTGSGSNGSSDASASLELNTGSKTFRASGAGGTATSSDLAVETITTDLNSEGEGESANTPSSAEHPLQSDDTKSTETKENTTFNPFLVAGIIGGVIIVAAIIISIITRRNKVL